VSFVFALAVGALLGGVGVVGSPLLIAVILSVTAAGVVLPVLQDSADTVDDRFGEACRAAAAQGCHDDAAKEPGVHSREDADRGT
jgi:hypothetical protein